MKIILFILLSFLFLIFQGCEKVEINQEEINPFERDYFYYTFNFEKIPLYLKGSELYVSFLKDTVSKEEAISILSKYSNLTDSLTPLGISNHDKLRVNINPDDTLHIEKILKTLNQDPNIDFATAIFTYSPDKSTGFIIPINEIICDPYITKDALRKLISGYNLSIIMSKPEHLFYLLKICDINNGFEPLEIANKLYESQKFNYCHPNFIAPFDHFR